jgi:hypothetical protein
MGLSHLQDLRPRDSGAGLAPVACGSHDVEFRFLAEEERRRATDPGRRFSNGAGWDSAIDMRSVAIDVRVRGAIRRLRDKASKWPIRVRVTTANAG